MANADLKQPVTKTAPARNKLQLVEAASRHLRSVHRQPERIRKYFQHEKRDRRTPCAAPAQAPTPATSMA